MDAIGIESEKEKEEEEIFESFVCCVCRDLLYKPIVLSCGHISCFWCVHKSMNGLRDSQCPICRNPYHHFPNICQMLHFLLQKMYPLTYKIRELDILEEEKETGNFSPQLEPISQVKTGSAMPEECPNANDQVTETFTDSKNQQNWFCELITVEDVMCAGCKELLFRPVVLNCGHAYCESCLKHDETARCKVCQSVHPKGLPKVSLELVRFLEERFPKECACRRDTVQLKQVEFKGLKEPDNQSDSAFSQKKKSDSVPVLGDREPNVHVGVGCDFCGMYPIIGDRYKCKDCVEQIGFDLCGTCYKTTSKLPGRFNQQHTPEHKFELIQSSPLHHIFLRFREATGHFMDSNTALVIGNYSSEDSEHGSPPLSLTSITHENVENGMPASESSPGVEQDRDDSQPTT